MQYVTGALNMWQFRWPSEEEILRLSICDDGRGFADFDKKYGVTPGMGIKIMHISRQAAWRDVGIPAASRRGHGSAAGNANGVGVSWYVSLESTSNAGGRSRHVRHGMAMLINLEPDMEVFAEAGDGDEALVALKAGHHADIVLMDVSLKTLSGFEVIKSMHIVMPALPVLVVSMHDEGVYAERALRAGARGYVMKQEPGDVLITAIREVLRGNIYLSKPMQRQAVESGCDRKFRT